MKLFKKLRMWFWTKKRTIDFLTEFSTILDKRLDDSVHKVKELDQNKVYFLCLEGYSKHDVDLAGNYFDKIRSRIKWTVPQIIVINKEFDILTKKELETALQTKR